MMLSHFIDSLYIWLSIQVFSWPVIQISPVQVSWCHQWYLPCSFNVLNYPLSPLLELNSILLISFLFFIIDVKLLRCFVFFEDLNETFSALLARNLPQSIYHLIVLLLAYVTIVLTVDHPISLVFLLFIMHDHVLGAILLRFFLLLMLGCSMVLLAFHLKGN